MLHFARLVRERHHACTAAQVQRMVVILRRRGASAVADAGGITGSFFGGRAFTVRPTGERRRPWRLTGAGIVDMGASATDDVIAHLMWETGL